MRTAPAPRTTARTAAIDTTVSDALRTAPMTTTAAMTTSTAAATTRVERCRRRACGEDMCERLGLDILRGDATRAFEEDAADHDQDARDARAARLESPLTCQIAAVDTEPADGVPDVDAGREGSDVGARPRQDETVDGLVRREAAGMVLDGPARGPRGATEDRRHQEQREGLHPRHLRRYAGPPVRDAVEPPSGDQADHGPDAQGGRTHRPQPTRLGRRRPLLLRRLGLGAHR